MNVYIAGYQAVSILHGGPQTQIRSTAQSLESLGWKVKLFDPWAAFAPVQGDLFHLFGANIGTYHLAREIRALRMPIVVSPITYSRHSHRFIHTSLRMSRLMQRMRPGIWTDYALCADICGWADQVVPNSHAEAALLTEGLGISPLKVSVVPNGVEERFAGADPAPFFTKFGMKEFILCVGHTGHERKNVLRLIQALAKIDHPAVIIGRIINSPYGAACVREAAKNKRILLLDGIAHDDAMLASAYAACDLFVLPSLFETPGIAALEAGLAGAKIVITKYGGPVEYFADMATYIEPESVESIREGIVKGLNQRKDDRLREHIRTHYLWQRVAEITAGIYRKVGEGTEG